MPTRRGVLQALGIVFANALTANAEENKFFDSVISLEDAIKNPGLRQDYLEQLLKKEFANDPRINFVDKILYFNRAEMLEDLVQQERLMLANPMLVYLQGRQLAHPALAENFIRTYSSNERFRKLDKKERRKRIIEFLNSDEGAYHYAEILVHRIIAEKAPYVITAYGKTVPSGDKYAIIMSETSFKPTLVKELGALFPVTEEGILGIISHELEHASDLSKGIQLGNVYLTKSRLFALDEQIAGFIVEGRARSAELAYTSRFNRGESLHASYLLNAYEFREFLFKVAIPMARRWITPESTSYREMVEHHFRECMKFYEETSRARLFLQDKNKRKLALAK